MDSYVFYAETNYPTYDMDGCYFEPMKEPTPEDCETYEWMCRMGYDRMPPDDPPTFPNDDHRPTTGPPKMMRCG